MITAMQGLVNNTKHCKYFKVTSMLTCTHTETVQTPPHDHELYNCIVICIV